MTDDIDTAKRRLLEIERLPPDPDRIAEWRALHAVIWGDPRDRQRSDDEMLDLARHFTWRDRDLLDRLAEP